MKLNATYWVLPSTEGSKYAHAPNWSVHAQSTPQRRPACNTPLPSWDHMSMEQEAHGKPPCPRCIERLQHHLDWLTAWLESYTNLDWTEGED